MQVLTNPGVDETVTAPPARTPRPKREPKLPTVEEFKAIVKRHCDKWQVTSVDNLCHPQTGALIADLAPLFR